MRVSNQMMADNTQLRLAKHMEKLIKSQEQIATGKRINRLSDDPIGMEQALAYRKTLSEMEQYNDNITDAKLHINTVENMLDTITDLLMEAKQVAADLHPDMRGMLADDVAIIREQVLDMANSQINGNYVFAGDLTDTQPFNTAGVYAGDSGTKDFIIGNSLQINIEADGSQIFQGVSDIFTVLSDLETALNADDYANIVGQIVPLTDAIENLNTIRAVNAGQYKRLEATEAHYNQFRVNTEDLLSQTEDTDIAKAIIDLKVQETAYESTLAVSARIIQPSLVDFLR